MDEKQLGKCGYYCGQCPSLLAKECAGCASGNERAFAIHGTVYWKRVSYPADTVRISLAEGFRTTPRQLFSAHYGSSGRQVKRANRNHFTSY